MHSTKLGSGKVNWDQWKWDMCTDEESCTLSEIQEQHIEKIEITHSKNN